jgi:hypothetical protein
MFNYTSLGSKITISVIVLLGCFSCQAPKEKSFETPKSKIDFSFSTAGHVYGEMGDKTIGIHQHFKNARTSPESDFLILLGDAVYKSSNLEWDKTIDQLNKVNDSLIFTIGNHEYNQKENFLKVTNRERTYFSFNHKKSLFIILDSELSSKGIVGKQLAWLKEELNSPKTYDNIFVFLHKLLWWNKENVYSELTPNSVWNTDHLKLNFWSELEPTFNNLTQDVYLIAGDMGGGINNDGYMYHNYENIHLVGSGMGASEESNYLTFNVHKTKEVSIELHSFHSDSVFNLKSFTVPFSGAEKQPLKHFHSNDPH